MANHLGILTVLSTLSTLVVSQLPLENFNDTISNCSLLYQVDTSNPINASRSVELDIGKSQDQPWFLGAGINASSLWVGPRVFISVPNDTRAEVCMHSFTPQNRTVDGDGKEMGGCKGIIPQACFEALGKIQLMERGNDSSRHRCPIDWDRDEITRVCGPGEVFSTYLSTRFSNNTCRVENYPGFEAPDGYFSYPIGSAYPGFAIEESDKQAQYDLRSRQSVPYVIAAAFSDDRPSVNEVRCFAPDQVQEGSRAFEGPWPLDELKTEESNDAVGKTLGLGGWVGMGAAGVFAVMTML